MLDIKAIRENPEYFETQVKLKGVDGRIDQLLALDSNRRQKLSQADEFKSQRNSASKQIGVLKKAGESADEAIAAMKKVGDDIAALDQEIREVEAAIDSHIMALPNIALESVPEGADETGNIPIREWGAPVTQDFKPVDHKALAESLKLIDFERGAKISGSGFPVYTGLGAKLERALIQFFLDTLTEKFGFTEIMPPLVVNRASMTGTGQLPKMEEDMYHCQEDDLFLIPTAEVPVTNLHGSETMTPADLPISYCAYSACFRREAGSYGKDTRGLLRLHQFNKVEMVKFVEPDRSDEMLETLVSHSEYILQQLGLHYRVLELCKGDLSFAAAKCYDLETWSTVEDKWLEVSSVSTFTDFQARRANIRFKGDPKHRFIHTLNGSGLATPRVMVSILDTYQQADGSFVIPEVLRPYMGGMEKIEKS